MAAAESKLHRVELGFVRVCLGREGGWGRKGRWDGWKMNNTKRKTTAAACFSWRKLGQQQHTCLHVTRHAALLCVVLCLVVCCLPCCQCDSMCSKETQATDWIGQPKNGQHFLERNFIGVSANYPILPPKASPLLRRDFVSAFVSAWTQLLCPVVCCWLCGRRAGSHALL